MNLAAKIIFFGLTIGNSVDIASAVTSLTEAIKENVVSGNVNLRYEDVDNSAVSSDLLNLRSRLTLASGEYRKFSTVVGVEDIRKVFGIDDPFGLVNDQDVTEIDQAYVQYQTQTITAKVGRQALPLANRRFIATARWRQDRRTLDAVQLQIKP